MTTSPSRVATWRAELLNYESEGIERRIPVVVPSRRVDGVETTAPRARFGLRRVSTDGGCNVAKPARPWGRAGDEGDAPHRWARCFSTTGHGYPPESACYPRWPSRFASLGVDHLPDRIDLAAHLVVLAELASDLVAGVQHRRMIAAAQLRTDVEAARCRSPRGSGTSRSGAAPRSRDRALRSAAGRG